MRLSALLVPLVLLAGCAAGPLQTASTEGIDDLAPPAKPRVESVLDPEGGHGEPSFGVAPDGTLYANGEGGEGGAVYRSTDGGATWERIATPVEPMPNMDPDLAVDKDGTIWFSALWIGCTSTATSKDGGETWTMNPLACNAPVSDRQYVIPTSGGTAYLYSHQLPTFWQLAAKTTDHGATWIPTAPVEPPTNTIATRMSGWGGGGFWNEAKDSVYLTWTWSEGGLTGTTWTPGFAVTRDGGASWETGAAQSNGGDRLGLGLVVGAADKAGNVYLAWGETLEESTAVFMARSTDDGATWTGPFRVDEGNGSKVFPAITAGAAGKVGIAYYEADVPGFPDDADGQWNVTLAWTDDALAPTPAFTRMTLNAEPVKDGPICISGTTCQGGREFLDYFQVHVLPDGRVGAIFNALRDDTLLEVFAATDAAILG